MPLPSDILEERELLLTSPPREAITARGVYRRADGSSVVLPDAVQPAREAPEVFSPGTTHDLTVHRGAHGWEATLPPSDRDTVRVVARTSLDVAGLRLFTTRWPVISASETTRARVPVRRVALVPRTALARAPGDWTCTDDGSDEIPCVSTVSVPEPLTLSFHAARSPRGAWPVALAAIVLVLTVLARTGSPARRSERAIGVLAGAVVGAAVALALVGALWTHWALALAVCVPALAALGAIATRTRAAITAAGLGLFSIPLLAVLDGRPIHVLGATLLSALAIAVLARFGTPFATPTTPQRPESSPAPPPESSPSP
jgi:hypothetical protein